jgi:hypothetical protein
MVDDLVVETPILPREDPVDDYIQYTESLRIANKLAGEAEADDEQPQAIADIEDHGLQATLCSCLRLRIYQLLRALPATVLSLMSHQ